jgi:hypothetical protein
MIDQHSNTTGRRRGQRLRRAALTVGLAVVGIGAVAASPAAAATGSTGVHYRSAATCMGISSPVVAGQSRVRVAAPTIYAANTTAGLDAQYVSFRQRLVRWNGARWVATDQYSAVWRGFATDARAAVDFTSGTRTVRRPSFDFTAGPGYYAVVTDYWWPRGSDSAYAYHTPSANTGYCGFVY